MKKIAMGAIYIPYLSNSQTVDLQHRSLGQTNKKSGKNW